VAALGSHGLRRYRRPSVTRDHWRGIRYKSRPPSRDQSRSEKPVFCVRYVPLPMPQCRHFRPHLQKTRCHDPNDKSQALWRRHRCRQRLRGPVSFTLRLLRHTITVPLPDICFTPFRCDDTSLPPCCLLSSAGELSSHVSRRCLTSEWIHRA
jgi:hypothetical protein